MDSDTHSAFGRLEIVETGPRRRWSEDEKVRIVLESLVGPRLVSATARRHGVSRAQLLTWRRKIKVEGEGAATPSFLPVVNRTGAADRAGARSKVFGRPWKADRDRAIARAAREDAVLDLRPSLGR